MTKFPITSSGIKKLHQEINHLKYVERPAIIDAIATAREFGDLSENAEYHAAKEKQSLIENKIVDLENKLSRAEVIDISKLTNESVKFGSSVSLLNEDTGENFTYHIVGAYEADITKKRISINSPIAKALIGKTIGNIVEVNTPNGYKAFQILKISVKPLDKL